MTYWIIPLVILMALVVFGLLFYIFRYSIPGLMGLKRTPGARQRIAEIRATGAALYSTQLNATIGGVNLRGSLGVEVYPGGIVLLPSFMVGAAIPQEQIRHMRIVTELYPKGAIEITHSAADVVSPVDLRPSPWRRAELVGALERMSGLNVAGARDNQESLR